MAQKKSTARSKAKGKPAAKSAAQKAAQKKEHESSVSGRTVLAVISLMAAVLTWFACFSTEGFLLAWTHKLLCGLLGTTGFYLSAIAFPAWFFILMLHRERPVFLRSLSVWMLVISVSAISHLSQPAPELSGGLAMVGDLFLTGAAGKSGGVLGGLVGIGVQLALDKVLSILVLVVLSLFWFLMSCNITVPSIIRAIRNRPRPEKLQPEPKEDPAARVVNHIAEKHIAHVEKKRNAADFDIPVDGKPIGGGRKKKPSKQEKTVRSREDLFDEEPITGSTVIPAAQPETDPEPLPVLPQEEPIPEIPIPEVQPASVDQVMEKVSAKDARDSAKEVAQEIAQQAMEPKPEYHFPPVNLLKSAANGAADGTAEMRENSRRLNKALQSLHIEAKICNVTRGPSVTRYEVELAQGVRLAKVTALQDDIALALGATGVRISAIPDKIAVVGIEVPNKLVTTVALREVIDSPQFTKAKSRSSFAVGKDIGGACVVGDIAKLPHMLIAGTTGSGKSVCMNSIIISLLYKAKPEDVKLIMVDPKMVELGIYNGIPHLLIPVVTDPKKAAGSLQWAVTEMMRRYKAMSDMGVRDLESFNKIVDSSGEGERLPQIVVIIDELADLMLVAAKEVEESICRIAQMGRAAGMHLIIATQRPSSDVITGLMKANIPSRIAFAVASAMESRIILDTQGAEKLVGRGDMLYAPLGSGKPRRIQGCFVSDGEVEAVAEFVKSNYVPDYDEEVLEEIEKKAEQSGKGGKASDSVLDFEDDSEAGDELLPAAVDVILETGQASVSMLQRRLKLGYARAARIVDEMEEKGIVGPFMGSKPRTILVTKEQWQQMQGGQMSIPEPEVPVAEEDS